MKGRLVVLILCGLVLWLASACGRQLMPERWSKPQRITPENRFEHTPKVEAEEKAPLGPMRTWTAADGKSSVEGALVEVRDGKVWLKQENGNLSGIPLERLSPADRDYARETAR